MIFTGSGSRYRPNPGMSSYASAKLGMWMLTQTLAAELQDANISVNELIPGPVRTEMTGFGETLALAGRNGCGICPCQRRKALIRLVAAA